MDKIPLLIPLSNGSTHGNDELRYLLRSIERNAIDAGTVYLMTVYKPDWIREGDDLVVVPLPDLYKDCKDANLFKKTHDTLKLYGIGDFVWTADDAAILRPIELSEIPVLHNHRPNSIFYEPNQGKWRARVKDTLEWAKSIGVQLPHTYEVHCPQKFNGKAILDGMKGVSYYPEGKTIYTTWRTVTGTWQGSLNQPDYKWTFENPIDETVTVMTEKELCSKPFIGYNDQTSERVLARLAKMFPLKSKYEK